MIRGLRKGVAFFYLPDMDLGPKDSLFVPFFGVPAAKVAGITERKVPAQLPFAPPAVLGVVGFQGRMVTVVDPLVNQLFAVGSVLKKVRRRLATFNWPESDGWVPSL